MTKKKMEKHRNVQVLNCNCCCVLVCEYKPNQQRRLRSVWSSARREIPTSPTKNAHVQHKSTSSLGCLLARPTATLDKEARSQERRARQFHSIRDLAYCRLLFQVSIRERVTRRQAGARFTSRLGGVMAHPHFG
jgi:hypothetical protein